MGFNSGFKGLNDIGGSFSVATHLHQELRLKGAESILLCTISQMS